MHTSGDAVAIACLANALLLLTATLRNKELSKDQIEVVLNQVDELAMQAHQLIGSKQKDVIVTSLG